jgi:hypothetical protein
VPSQLAATAQAIYGTVGIGAATPLLTLVSGWLYGRMGPPAFAERVPPLAQRRSNWQAHQAQDTHDAWLVRKLTPAGAIAVAALAGAIRWMVAAFTIDVAVLSTDN